MLVYRWQTADAEGAYMHLSASELAAVSGESHDRWTGRPAPRDDVWQRGETPDFHGRHFGFASRSQEKGWFRDSERRYMRERGLSLVAYEVDACQVDIALHQCVFPMDSATFVGEVA